MKARNGVLFICVLLLFTGCSESAYKPYVKAIEKTEITEVQHRMLPERPETNPIYPAQRALTSPLKENYPEIRLYWAALLDRNCVSEKGKEVVKTSNGDVKATRYKVHPSSDVVQKLETYLKAQALMSPFAEIISYEEEGLVDLDGFLIQFTVTCRIEFKENQNEEQKWVFTSHYGYE